MIYKFILVMLIVPSMAFSYTVIRQDGKRFDGELIRETENIVVIEGKDGVSIHFEKNQIDWDKTTAARRDSEMKSKGRIHLSPAENRTREIRRQSRLKWTGERLSVDFKDVDIRDFFRFIADVSGMNIILDPQVSGTLTLKMTDVPWDQLLDVVCRTYGYGWEIDGNVVSVDR